MHLQMELIFRLKVGREADRKNHDTLLKIPMRGGAVAKRQRRNLLIENRKSKIENSPPRLLITAGPTHEPIDAVRYLANRSSGKLGVALAAAGRAAGWDVTLLLGPSCVPPPADAHVERFESTADLAGLLDEHFGGCDVLVMAAAVADYRPVRSTAGKLPRTAEKRTIELEPTPDLVAACAERKRPDQHVIGFALETPERLNARAAEKLSRKRLDAIVANPLATMGGGEIEATIMTASGETHSPGSMTKQEFARWLIGWIDREFTTPST